MLEEILPPVANTVAYAVIVISILIFAVDIICVASGLIYDTVSTKIRILDLKSGNIIAWLFLGLWLHLFIPINNISIGNSSS